MSSTVEKYFEDMSDREVMNAKNNKLKDFKYLCGDDYHPAHPGCKRAIDEFLESDEREFYHHDFETGSGFWTAVK